MKRMLNTLFVTTHGSYLARDGETVLVRAEREIKIRIPVHTLDSIVCFGGISASSPLMQLCAENDVPISFLSQNGRFYARVEGPVSGNVLLRREQYRRADSPKQSAKIARWVVAAKISNARGVILRAIRDHPDTVNRSSLRAAARRMRHCLERVQQESSLQVVRGLEGEAAATYFGVFQHLITRQKDDFRFSGRNRRPPLDRSNALLSFLYAVLLNDVCSSLEATGLDPAVGYLHRDRPGRPGLGLDLMEELRPVIADRLALSLINRRQITKSDFREAESGAVLLNDKGRRTVLVSYQNRKQSEVTHPFTEEKMPIGMVPYAQALLLARFLRDDLDAYPPLLWK